MNTSTLTTSITIPKMDLSLLKDLAKKFGWTINNTTSKTSGLEEALNDVKNGNIHHANSAKDLIDISEPLFGPTSIEEAISRVQDAEKEYTLNGRGTTLNEFTAELTKNFKQ